MTEHYLKGAIPESDSATLRRVRNSMHELRESLRDEPTAQNGATALRLIASIQVSAMDFILSPDASVSDRINFAVDVVHGDGATWQKMRGDFPELRSYMRERFAADIDEFEVLEAAFKSSSTIEDRHATALAIAGHIRQTAEAQLAAAAAHPDGVRFALQLLGVIVAKYDSMLQPNIFGRPS